MIERIEQIAALLADNDPIKARSLIVGWSAFQGTTGTVSIEGKPWNRVSEKWQTAILYKAQAAFKKQGGTLPLFDSQAALKPKRPYKSRRTAAKPYDESIGDKGVRMPADGPENRPEWLSF